MEDKLLYNIRSVIKEVIDYLDICGFSLIYIIKSLDMLKHSNKIYEYKIAKPNNELSITLVVELHMTASSCIIEKPYYTTIYKDIEFKCWR